jgi:hypothetical protein
VEKDRIVRIVGREHRTSGAPSCIAGAVIATQEPVVEPAGLLSVVGGHIVPLSLAMKYRADYALEEYIRLDFCGGRYGTFVRQGQRSRHCVDLSGYRRAGWEARMRSVAAAVAAAAWRRRGSGSPAEEASVRASIKEDCF